MARELRENTRIAEATVSDLIYAKECYQIVGACFEVYDEKGCGFLEPVYHDCLELEFRLQKIGFLHEPDLRLTYKGQPIRHEYSPDFTCWDKIVLEVKAAENLTDEHIAQVLNYLNATGYELGVLVNFGHYPGLEWKRVVHSKGNSRPFA
jgi:GxxExxY protein